MTRRIADEMRDKLAALSPSRLLIIDESDQHAGHAGWREGGESHFRIRMTSPAFNGLNRLARERLIHRTLGDIMLRIHALSLELTAE